MATFFLIYAPFHILCGLYGAGLCKYRWGKMHWSEYPLNVLMGFPGLLGTLQAFSGNSYGVRPPKGRKGIYAWCPTTADIAKEITKDIRTPLATKETGQAGGRG